MAKNRIRVRLCLKDIYRYLSIGEKEEILGIHSWSATLTGISIVYDNGRRKRYRTRTEDERKEAIKIINKYISEVHN